VDDSEPQRLKLHAENNACIRTASAAAQTPVDCSELHQQPVVAVLRPTFIQKLRYKLPSVVTFTFLQIFDQNFVVFTKQRQVGTFA